MYWHNKDRTITHAVLVDRGGFEPPKSVTADLQSAPFGHSGTYPYMELVMGLEPATC